MWLQKKTWMAPAELSDLLTTHIYHYHQHQDQNTDIT